MPVLKVLKCISCCIIVVVNIISMIFALIFSALGAALLFGAPLAKQYLIPMINKMTAYMPKQLSDTIDMDKIVQQFLGYASGAGMALMIVGLVLLAVSIIGCCGACYDYKILLIIYVVCVGLILLAFVGITIMLAKDKMMFFNQLETGIMSGIKKEFKGFSSPNSFTMILSFGQMYLNCCGAKGGSDFKLAVNWNKTYEIKKAIMGTTYSRKVQLKYPVSCCKTENFKPIDFKCTFNATKDNSNYDTGCIQVITNMTKDYMGYISYGLWGICFIIGLLTAAAIIMVIALFSDSKVSPV